MSQLERSIRQLSDEAHRGVITKEQHDAAFDRLILDEAKARGIRLPQKEEPEPKPAWDGRGLPIRPTEVLPNGATVVDIQWTSPPPSERQRYFVLCVWDRASNAQGYEFIVWELFPDTMACEHGSYTPELAHAVSVLTERLNRAQEPWRKA